MTRSSPSTYVDVLGRPWPTKKLDALLADQDVRALVLPYAGPGLNPDGNWSPGRVLRIVKYRYRRQEPSALMLLLVTRFFDTEGARFLVGEPERP